MSLPEACFDIENRRLYPATRETPQAGVGLPIGDMDLSGRWATDWSMTAALNIELLVGVAGASIISKIR